MTHTISMSPVEPGTMPGTQYVLSKHLVPSTRKQDRQSPVLELELFAQRERWLCDLLRSFLALGSLLTWNEPNSFPDFRFCPFFCVSVIVLCLRVSC